MKSFHWFFQWLCLDQTLHVLNVSDIKCSMKDAVMSFVAREETDSVLDCAAQLKANGDLCLSFKNVL